MPQTNTATLREIFSDTLANLAFMFVDDEQVDPDPHEDWFQTTIRYKGPGSGQLGLICPRSFTTALAANLLGVNPEDRQANSKAIDAVKELMNILCGQLVTQVYGSDVLFNLSIPRCRLLDEPPCLHGPDDGNACTVSIGGSPVRLIHTTTAGEEPDD
jgi:hypothetical protein